ncbi:ATP-dependent RNA helicase DBP8-like [Strongylocentrotus purpuratus]|nr:ATP-dependent RNA helicase DBP8-like [Strongylocentrotus purpuratus]
MLIYTKSVNTCQKIYCWIAEETKGACCGCHYPARHRLVEQYHSHTTGKKSDKIITDFCSRSSCTRVIVTTLALSLGVDVPDVEIVVNWGVESALSYWQEVGRCARNLDKGLAILYAYKRSLHQTNDSTMKEMVNEENCARDTILGIFKIPGTPDLEKKERVCHKLNCTEKAPCTCSLCMCCSSCYKRCTCAHKYVCVLARLAKKGPSSSSESSESSSSSDSSPTCSAASPSHDVLSPLVEGIIW